MQQQADEWLRDLVRRCARAYRALSRFECKEALREMDGLPAEIQESIWGLEMVAKCFYEMANYTLVSYRPPEHRNQVLLHEVEDHIACTDQGRHDERSRLSSI